MAKAGLATKGFIVVVEEHIQGYFSTLEEAKKNAAPGNEIYEVSKNWKLKATINVRLTPVPLAEIFDGE